jgi:hypothetical protein
MDLFMNLSRPRLRALLHHFAKINDARQAWKVMDPLREVLFLVVCGKIPSDDDYDDIVDWGNAYLALLCGFAEFHFGIPCADWLRSINRIDPTCSWTEHQRAADDLVGVQLRARPRPPIQSPPSRLRRPWTPAGLRVPGTSRCRSSSVHPPQ